MAPRKCKGADIPGIRIDTDDQSCECIYLALDKKKLPSVVSDNRELTVPSGPPLDEVGKIFVNTLAHLTLGQDQVVSEYLRYVEAALAMIRFEQIEERDVAVLAACVVAMRVSGKFTHKPTLNQHFDQLNELNKLRILGYALEMVTGREFSTAFIRAIFRGGEEEEAGGGTEGDVV